MIEAAELASYDWLSIPMWVFDKRQLRITWANASALEFWDAASLADLRQRDFSDMTPTALVRLDSVYRSALEGVAVEEQWTLYPRGRPKQIVLTSNVVRAADGSTDGILFCAAHLRAVPDSQLRGVQVLSYTATVVALYRLDGTVLFRNPAAVVAWDELPGRAGVSPLHATFASREDAEAIVAAVSRQERVMAEFTMLTSRQGERIFELDCRPLTDPVDAKLVLGISGRDVTEYRQVEKERDALREAQLRRARAAAESEKELTVAARKVFMATASHELRTPLQSIMSSLELLERYPHEIETCIGPLREATQQLNQIAADLVEFVRADSAPGLRLRVLHLSTFLRRTLSQIRKQALAKNLEFTTDFEGMDLRIEIDEIRMRQILTNVAGNAVKYTPSGSVSVKAALSPDGRLSVSVKDTGVGMSKAATSRAVEPFVRGRGSRLLNPQGLGLGLAIVQSHLADMGGRMKIESEPQKGTEVTLLVPCRRVEAEPDGPAST
ncbi:PAS domain-containing sensor histidine kinase [Eleftheria terrae]|uniref:PAS domain-containing sensor histidine kinase n=1 Tax=Eleftheria terrae TaxID=1597781 RepID=UPI00263A9B84|nr:PAS domain-containing sensor histidine kinase [Eleftheria terrae]WKB55557.1 PAS domain-containing sensor histidine kinase [Eleftheria terrae]